MMNIIEINKRIKQRPPFQMVDRVLEVVPGESVKALKNVSVNEPYFMGHFPDSPIMPGVIIDCEKTMGASGLFTFAVKVSVDSKVRAKGELMFTAVDKESIYAQE